MLIHNGDPIRKCELRAERKGPWVDETKGEARERKRKRWIERSIVRDKEVSLQRTRSVDRNFKKDESVFIDRPTRIEVILDCGSYDGYGYRPEYRTVDVETKDEKRKRRKYQFIARDSRYSLDHLEWYSSRKPLRKKKDAWWLPKWLRKERWW